MPAQKTNVSVEVVKLLDAAPAGGLFPTEIIQQLSGKFPEDKIKSSIYSLARTNGIFKGAVRHGKKGFKWMSPANYCDEFNSLANEFYKLNSLN